MMTNTSSGNEQTMTHNTSANELKDDTSSANELNDGKYFLK
jgi:hypothetical protein